MAQRKQPFQECLGEAVYGAIRAVAANYQTSRPSYFFRKFRVVVLNLTNIILFTTQTGDARTYLYFTQFDKLRLKTTTIQDSLDQTISVALLNGTS
jgi:serine/threonine protein phosphatase PrpC